MNSFENIIKDDNNNEKYITVNKSLKYFKKRCKSFHQLIVMLFHKIKKKYNK